MDVTWEQGEIMKIQYHVNYGMYPLHPSIDLEALSCCLHSFPYIIAICVTAASIFTFSGMVPIVRNFFFT
jgi:hypothetical protein